MTPAATSTTAEVVAELLDREQIRDLLHRYVDRIDALDLEAVGAMFVEDATVELLGFRREGREAIVRHLGRALGGFERTSHHVTNPLIRVDGDRAEQSAGVYAYHRRAADGSPWHFWGRYRQELQRTDAGWRLTHLELVGIDGGPDAAPEERNLYAGHPDRSSL